MHTIELTPRRYGCLLRITKSRSRERIERTLVRWLGRWATRNGYLTGTPRCQHMESDPSKWWVEAWVVDEGGSLSASMARHLLDAHPGQPIRLPILAADMMA